MTPRFVLSKVRQFLLRLWVVDTDAMPRRMHDGTEALARSRVRPVYARNGVKVVVSAQRTRAHE